MSEQHTSVETTPQGFFSSLHERMESKKAKTLLVIGIGIAALTGCAQQEAPHSSPSSSSVEATPTPTAASPEWFHQQDVLERSPITPELQKYRDMSTDQFRELPKAEQWIYVSWLMQYAAQFSDWFSQITGNANDKLPTLSPDSTARELYSFDPYLGRIATYVTVDAPKPDKDGYCGTLDRIDATKIMIATMADSHSPVIDKQVQDIVATTGGRAMCPSLQAQARTFDNSKLTIDREKREQGKIDGTPVTVVHIQYTSAIKHTIKQDEYIMPITTYMGATEYVSVSGDPLQIS